MDSDISYSRPAKDLIDYEYRMCLHSKPPYILAYQITVTGDSCKGRLLDRNLSKVLSDDHELTQKDLSALLLAFAGMLDDCREYLLDFGKVKLGDDEIFRRTDGSMAFMYTPFEILEAEGGRRRVEQWLANLYQHVDMTNEGTMAILHPLSIALADEHFSLEDFETLIRKTVEG